MNEAIAAFALTVTARGALAPGFRVVPLPNRMIQAPRLSNSDEIDECDYT